MCRTLEVNIRGELKQKKIPDKLYLPLIFVLPSQAFTFSHHLTKFDEIRLGKRKSHGGKAVHNRDISLERSVEFQSLETQLIDFNDNQYFTFDIDSANKSQSYEH